MQTILSVIKQELRERTFSWITLIFFLMLVFQGVWYTKGTFDYFVNEGVLMNAPSIFYRNFAGMGMLMIIIIAISTGGVLYKDIQHKSAQWVYALPVSDKQFFIGRYLAAFLYLGIVSTGFFVGMLLVPYSGIGEAHRFGPAPIGQMFHGMLIFTLPNLLLYTSLVFFALVFTRRMAVGYLAVFVMVIFFLIVQTSYETGNTGAFYILGDPNGYVTAEYYSDMLSVADKNTAYFSFDGYLLQNRLIWLSLTVILFVLAYRKFSFKYFIAAGTSSSKKLNTEFTGDSSRTTAKLIVTKSFIFRDFLFKLYTLAKVELLNIVRPVSFRIILVIMAVMIILQNITWNANYYIGPEMPLSSNMTFFRLQWGVFIMMLLMIWSGELFFKDKTTNIWQITDALPVPVWVSQLSKYFAAIGLAFVLCIAFIIIGILCQVLMGGGAYIDLSRYVEDLLGFRWGFLNFVLYITLVFFTAGLTGNRLVTHIVCVGYFLFTIISFDMDLFEQIRYGYGLVPGIEDYSELSGYGIHNTAANWFFTMWFGLGVAFVLAGILFWNRGTGQRWSKKLLFTGKQLNIAGKIAIALSLVAFFTLQSFIAREAYDNGNFTAELEEEMDDADYERKYKYLASKHQPKYSRVDLVFDYFPEERKAVYSAELKLVNGAVTDTLFLNWKDFVTVKQLTLSGQALVKVADDEVQHVSAYLIPDANRSDPILSLTLKAEKQYTGFTQGDFQEDLMFNGSFGSVKDFLPHIGYKSDRELQENRKREDNGLSKLTSRMADVSDSIALQQDAFADDAMWVTGSITIGTSGDQIAVAPGLLTTHSVADGRNYYTFELKEAAPFNWYVASADYESTSGSADNTKFEIMHKASHSFNIEVYKDALRKGIGFINTTLGEYPYNELRLIEINHLTDDPVYAFANTIAISEKEGWVADVSGLKEKAYVYQTIGASLARHWVSQKIHVAHVQGADMLKVALPEALGLLFVRQTLGNEAVELLIKKKMDKYGKDKNNEPNTEPPLLYADGADYLEINKGAVELYNAINAMGFEKFNEAYRYWVSKDRTHVFKNFYDSLLSETSADMLREKFEHLNN